MPDGAALPQVLYTEALAEEIIETVRTSPRSVEWLCAQHPHWPSPRTLYNWKRDIPEFRAAFDYARHDLAHVLAFQAVEIADDGSGDAREVTRQDGSTFVVQDQEFAKRSELRVKVRQWLSGKLAPETYGDRLAVDARLTPVLSQEEALDQLR